MLEELELKAPIEDLDDPYVVLGYGVNAYYQILASLARMFFWIFIFSLPIIYFYVNGRFFEGQPSYPISQTMAGNFGGSSMMCKNSRVATGKLVMECPHGTIFHTGYVQMGALSNQFTSFTWCNQEAIDVVLDKENQKNCSAAMGNGTRSTFKKQLQDKCH